MQGFTRTEPTWPGDGWTSDVGVHRVVLVARALVIVTIMSRFALSCLAIFMRSHVAQGAYCEWIGESNVAVDWKKCRNFLRCRDNTRVDRYVTAGIVSSDMPG